MGEEKRLKKDFGGFSFCYSEKTESGFRVMVHCPFAGEYTLKVFAKYYGERKSDTFVCTYYVNALAGAEPVAAASSKPGFSYLKDEFKEWGLEPIDQLENIVSHVSHVKVTLSNPYGIALKPWLFDAHNKQIGNSCPLKTR